MNPKHVLEFQLKKTINPLVPGVHKKVIFT